MSGGASSADASALFDGDRLTLARQLAGLKKSELARSIGKSPTIVSGWESGAKRPSTSSVAALAVRLGVDPGFFVVRPSNASRLSGAPHFRSLRATTLTVRDQATSYGQVAADIASVIEKYVELPELVLPHFSVPLEPDSSPTPEDAARWLRAEWNLPDGPLSHVVRLIENKGIIVVFSTPGASSVDAFSFDTDNRPLIILNPLKDDYYRQRFDAAHELGHLIMHRDSEPGGRVVEEQANRFASEFLMPEFEIRESLPTSINSRTWVQLGRLKEDWGASMQAILHKSRRLNLLTDGSYRNAMMTVSSRGWRRHEPGLTAALEQPSLLARSIEILLEGGFTESDLLSECRAPLSLFRQVVSRTPDPTN